MNWSRILHTVLPFIVLAFAVTAPFVSVSVQGSTVVPISRMNKTIHEQVRKQKFLKQVLFKLGNATGSHTFRKGFEPQSQESTIYVPSNQPQETLNNSMRENPLSLPRTVLPKEYRPSFPPLSLPNLVKSDPVEKNVLTFRFAAKTVQSSSLVTRINLWLYVSMNERKKKKKSSSSSSSSSSSTSSTSPSTRDLEDDKRRGRRRGKTIKIRVFMSDEKGSRGRRLAVLKRKISKSDWEKLGLPVSLIKTIAETESNNTLRLRVQCKRCTRRTQLVLPGNDEKRCKRERQRRMRKRRKKDKRSRRWRTNCAETRAGKEDTDSKLPFIVIEEKSTIQPGRFKRDSGSETAGTEVNEVDCQDPGAATAGAASSNTSRHDGGPCCKPVKTFVEFSDLKMDNIIVSPSGFEYVTCTGTCSDIPVSLPHQDKINNLKHSINSLPTRSVHQSNKSSRRPLLTSQTTTKPSRPPHHRHRRHHHHRQHHQHTRRDHWHNHKWSRLKQKLSCKPVETQNLVILHFTHDHNLVQSELPNFLVTKCGCNGHLPSAKDTGEV